MEAARVFKPGATIAKTRQIKAMSSVRSQWAAGQQQYSLETSSRGGPEATVIYAILILFF